MTPKRLSVKFFAINPEVLEIESAIAVLQRWIQERAVEGLLIDVVDYKHMYEGPGIILIGNKGDYALDLRDGRPGVTYILKQHAFKEGGALLEHVSRLVLNAAILLEVEDSLNGLKFDYSETKIEFQDRLNFRNQSKTWEKAQPILSSFAHKLYGDQAQIENAHDDPREVFAVCLKTEQTVNTEQLRQRLARHHPTIGAAF